ncbi:IdeS/Mac family cysteine endopeptidase [Mycoplasmopsis opalescens]|uniref:IdeS/Mac family cysteine endopeptidase n=1 Tax=Mycoplasmopsis opalescens TaxID=114886 RepID=UPI0004A7843B|nr:IdeS/Mac family cysteine endopeptidase [Mycoplasmopsis opalescens]
MKKIKLALSIASITSFLTVISCASKNDLDNKKPHSIPWTKLEKAKKVIPWTKIDTEKAKKVIPWTKLDKAKKVIPWTKLEKAKEIPHHPSEDEFWNSHPALLKDKTKSRYSLFLDGVNLDADAFYYDPEDPDEGYRYSKDQELTDWWFDTNKEFDSKDNFLCAAITAANWLHYWLKQNQKYVDKYLEDAQKGDFTIGSGANAKTFNLRELREIYLDPNKIVGHKVWRSKFFDFFKYRYSNTFVNPNKLFDHYVNGFPYNPGKDKFGGQNYKENYQPDQNQSGFFRDVFKDNILTKITSVRDETEKKQFSDTIIKAIKNKNPIGISHSNGTPRSGHIINVWGADFDEEKNVVGLYITNGDDPIKTFKNQKTNEIRLTNIVYYNVNYYKGKIKLTAGNNEEYGAEAWDLYTIDLGQKYFEEYFANKNK